MNVLVQQYSYIIFFLAFFGKYRQFLALYSQPGCRDWSFRVRKQLINILIFLSLSFV